MAHCSFAAQSAPCSCAENLATRYQDQFPDSFIAKNVTVGPSMVSYLDSREIVEGHSYFTLNFDEMVAVQVKKAKQINLPLPYLLEVHNGVKIKYLT